ncbi:MAG TPA: HepT-like ribonuclease domain-containing protein [Candidatus Sulfomarinibacteraceae bacterium]|nr:HepT-like ribonuclease domain-containing protein [Candidatus Sulfomarinibacteraceae bacterium]
MATRWRRLPTATGFGCFGIVGGSRPAALVPVSLSRYISGHDQRRHHAETDRKMVQFRNFIVHRYERVDVAILADLVNRQLDDFDQFRQEILDYVQR